MEEPPDTVRTIGASDTEQLTQATRAGLAGEATRPTAASCLLGTIDRYVLLRELGGGGFGVVYLARDTVAGVEVAVKGLPPMVRNNAEELERIRKNFALVSRLYHPNIAPALVLHQAREVHYADEHVRGALRVLAGDYLMVMAFAPGVTLNRWRRQFPEGKVPAGEALESCRQIASALDYAHGEKIIHRDVKPSNVVAEALPGGGLRCRVLDFGLAAEIHSSLSRVSSETFDTSGTRPYMAPEQWQGRSQGPQTDQYSLAVLFYELVSGAVPFAPAFETGDALIMMQVVEREKPAPLPQLTRAQNEALLKGLAKEPSKRFASCGELVEALDVNGGRRPLAAAARGRALRRAGVAAGLLLVMLTLYGGYRVTRSAPQDEAAKSAPFIIPPVARRAPEAPAQPPATTAVSQAATVTKPAVPAPAAVSAPVPVPVPALVPAPATLPVPVPVPVPAPPKPEPPVITNDLYAALGSKLAQTLPAGGGPFRLAFGGFFSGETRLMAAYSAVLRQELQRVLAAGGRFELAAPEQVAALLLGGGLSQGRLFEAGSEVTPAPAAGVDAVLRGRFLYYKDEVRVTAELVWLAPGALATVEGVAPAKSVMARLWPGRAVDDLAAQMRLMEVMTPQNEVASLKNIRDVEERVGKVPHDFDSRLVTADARRDYAEGEVCRYRFSSAQGCHVAVFCHQADGTSVVLFPNGWSRDTWVEAGQVVDLPGAAKGGFEIRISPPFGADVVQAVACTARSALHRLVAEVTSNAPPAQAYGVVARGVLTRSVAEGLAEAAAAREGPARWSEARLVICTYPRPGERPRN